MHGQEGAATTGTSSVSAIIPSFCSTSYSKERYGQLCQGLEPVAVFLFGRPPLYRWRVKRIRYRARPYDNRIWVLGTRYQSDVLQRQRLAIGLKDIRLSFHKWTAGPFKSSIAAVSPHPPDDRGDGIQFNLVLSG